MCHQISDMCRGTLVHLATVAAKARAVVARARAAVAVVARVVVERAVVDLATQ